MSWFWSSSRDSKTSDLQTKDVYADLSPELQAFVKEDAQTYSPPDGTQKTKAAAVKKGADSIEEPLSLPEVFEAKVTETKERKSQISAAARFNCAVAEYDLNQCFLGGSWWDKSKLCEEQKGAFWGCLESNKKALEILGYADPQNTPAQDDKILGIADDLCMKEAAANEAAAKAAS